MSAAGFNIPSRRLPKPALALALLTCGLAGCQSSQTSEHTAPAAPAGPPPKVEMGWEERPLGGVASGVASPIAVKEGSPPLFYLAESGVTVRIVDRAGDKIIAESPVPARTIVRVDQRTGVVVGKETLVGGPLPAGRRYAIMVVPQGENVSRSGRTQTVEPPPPVQEEVHERVVDPTGSGAGSN